VGSDSSKRQAAVGHGWFGLWNVIEGTTVVGCEHLCLWATSRTCGSIFVNRWLTVTYSGPKLF
jgi:hypothetical protein